MTSNIPGDASFKFATGTSGGNPTLLVTATSSGAAQTVHTAVSGADDLDYLTVWASNLDGTDAYKVTLLIGAQQVGPFNVPALAAPFKLLDGWPVNNGVVVKAYADTGSKIVLASKAILIVEGTA